MLGSKNQADSEAEGQVTTPKTLLEVFNGPEQPTHYDEYLGPQCAVCGIEDYAVKFSCNRCDALVCSRCLDKHSERHQ